MSPTESVIAGVDSAENFLPQLQNSSTAVKYDQYCKKQKKKKKFIKNCKNQPLLCLVDLVFVGIWGMVLLVYKL